MPVSASALASAPRRRLTREEAPRCEKCHTRYIARNSYAERTRYQRVCACEGVPFARYLIRPLDLKRLDQIERVRLGIARR